MKIAFGSDLHLEGRQFLPEQFKKVVPENDLCVLAGDIFCFYHKDRLKYLEPFLIHATKVSGKVIAVAGNHEFYMGAISDSDKIRGFYESLGIEFLDKETTEYNGMKIFGGTFWTSMNDGDRNALKHAKGYLNDFWIIDGFSPEESQRIHEETIERMGNPDIVVSHHAPSIKSVDPKFSKETLGNFCYYSDINIPASVKLWIHGHVHSKFDYQLGGARIVCNPRGYSHEPKVHKGYTFSVVDL